MIRATYFLSIEDADAHLLSVRAVFDRDAPFDDDLTLFMPVWAPGSYLVREYARNVERLRDATGERLTKTRKNAWRVGARGQTSVSVTYSLYANDLTVRTNHVDRSHASWNGAATYLLPDVEGDVAFEVRVDVPDEWTIATQLEPHAATPCAFVAGSIDELVDAPFECGPMTPRTFDVAGRTHEVWVWSSPWSRDVDWDGVVRDLSRVVATTAALIAGDDWTPSRALPYERYAFLLYVAPRSRGGLEHLRSTAITLLPHAFGSREGRLDALSLMAHEHLHLWNVKRVRPAALVPLDLEREQHTRLLWWFEGATSYFDWYLLRRADVATPREYARHLAELVARVADTAGARLQTLEESSYDAWIKAYRPDESTPNTAISYYLKGEVVAALLDVTLRARTGGARSLVDVLRYLVRVHGETGLPVPEDGLPEAFFAATGVDVADEIARFTQTTEPLPVDEVLGEVGLAFEREPSKLKGSLGCRARVRRGRVVIDGLRRGGAGERAGLSVHDEILVVDGRDGEAGFDHALATKGPGDVATLLVSRDGRVLSFDVTLDAPLGGDARLVVRPDATSDQLSLIDGWLGAGSADALRVRG